MEINLTKNITGLSTIRNSIPYNEQIALRDIEFGLLRNIDDYHIRLTNKNEALFESLSQLFEHRIKEDMGGTRLRLIVPRINTATELFKALMLVAQWSRVTTLHAMDTQVVTMFVEGMTEVFNRNNHIGIGGASQAQHALTRSLDLPNIEPFVSVGERGIRDLYIDTPRILRHLGDLLYDEAELITIKRFVSDWAWFISNTDIELSTLPSYITESLHLSTVKRARLEQARLSDSAAKLIAISREHGPFFSVRQTDDHLTYTLNKTLLLNLVYFAKGTSKAQTRLSLYSEVMRYWEKMKTSGKMYFMVSPVIRAGDEVLREVGLHVLHDYYLTVITQGKFRYVNLWDMEAGELLSYLSVCDKDWTTEHVLPKLDARLKIPFSKLSKLTLTLSDLVSERTLTEFLKLRP